MELSVGELGQRPTAPSDRPNTPRVVLVRETSHFRRLAEIAPKALTRVPTDALTEALADANGLRSNAAERGVTASGPDHLPRLVLDIGSAYGHATEILATALGDPSRVIGIDLGRHFIEVRWVCCSNWHTGPLSALADAL